MTEPTPAVVPAPELGLMARAIGIITSPGRTFESIVQSPRPAAILLLVSLVMAVVAAAPQFTERGRQRTLEMQVQVVERMSGQPISDQMYQQMAAGTQSNAGGYWALVTTFIFMPVTALFFTAIYWALFNAILGGTATFKQVLGVVAHSMVIMALGGLAAMPFQLMADQMTMTGPFHFGALVPMLPPESFLVRFLTGMNLFTLWQIAVIAIGLAVLYRRKASTIGTGLFLLYAALVAVFVTAFSGLMGR